MAEEKKSVLATLAECEAKKSNAICIDSKSGVQTHRENRTATRVGHAQQLTQLTQHHPDCTDDIAAAVAAALRSCAHVQRIELRGGASSKARQEGIAQCTDKQNGCTLLFVVTFALHH